MTTDRTRAEPCRILLLEANEDGTVGGSHRALFDLVRNLDHRRYKPAVLFYEDNVFAGKLRDFGIEVHLFDQIRAREKATHSSGRGLAKTAELFAAISRRFQFLRQQRIDLIHVNNSPRIANDDWLPAARLLRVPIISSAMGDAAPETTAVRRWLFRRFDMVLPVSAYIEDAMRRKGIPARRLRKVHHGVDIQELRARVSRSREEVRRELGVHEETVLAAMVANIREWKGQHMVLSALRLLGLEARARLHVLFIGVCNESNRAYGEALRRIAAEHGLESMVSFLGGRSDVPDLYNASDIALHASVHPEPGGIAVLEAMVLGKAVIAADKGGHVEYLLPDFGRVHDVENPSELAKILSELTDSPEERRRLGQAARDRVEEFSIQRNARETQQVYDSLLRQ